MPIIHHNFNNQSQHSGIMDINSLKSENKGILELNYESNLREYEDNLSTISASYKHTFKSKASFLPYAGIALSKYEIGAFNNNGVNLIIGSQYQSKDITLALGLGIGYFNSSFSSGKLRSIDYEDFSNLEVNNASIISINPTLLP